MENKTQAVVDALNEALDCDPEAIRKLFEFSVRCTKILADHPLIVCGTDTDGCHSIRLLGLINGVLGAINYPLVAAVQDDRSGSLVRFVAYTPKRKLSCE